MQTAFNPSVRITLPPTELGDYDFLRATYEALLRASSPDAAAIDAAFDALDAAHERFRAAHQRRVRNPEGVH
ncbi:MAG: hypothetical protein EON93_08160 [Burkholderiales bacterium]|nr:MAG: hypothetical protein EON93_08160 [Burkholderiales bacterium]